VEETGTSPTVGVMPKQGETRPSADRSADPRFVQMPRRIRRGRTKFRVTDDGASPSDASGEA
jgi:hypothetical protein